MHLPTMGLFPGAIEFYKEAKSRGIKPIIGMEHTLPAESTNKDPTKDKGQVQPYFVCEHAGLHKLMKLSTIAELGWVLS